ncbi:4Fe-4S binding protein [Tepidimicrobium xylanilyticum]|uniref:4Fe-4S binding domain-containing protein n=1 Tax=Tepidimicrobium xylanilyticum TaxID=1123352 RepID=A0A1H2XIR3_9FIRM|nr:4Fe-4S binding protein [Tepidimicrobium xylanilyticum]SDW92354.1 4Fe-4S binding domain-containing protein [Tepidimicrobium xylanilyticum]
MDKQYLIKIAEDFVENSEDNYISKEIAISENVVGMKIFGTPIFAFGSADDEYFTLLKQPSAIGEHFMVPKEWLPQSRTVISFFLPFSEAVKMGNRMEKSWPSEEWLHGRIEGQAFVNKLCMNLKSVLTNAGYCSLVPALDERFWSNNHSTQHKTKFTSNWSERHVAFVCGLGTFGLSKGLITPKGVAGRFGSIITELYLSPDKREYKNIYEYCSMCGKCVKKCPVNAITIENGKNHHICSVFLDITSEKYKPRYGCGKCQVEVPCESRIP